MAQAGKLLRRKTEDGEKPVVAEWLSLLRANPSAFNSFLADLIKQRDALFASYPAAANYEKKKEIDGMLLFVQRWLHSVTVDDKQAVAHEKYLRDLEEKKEQTNGRATRNDRAVARYAG